MIAGCVLGMVVTLALFVYGVRLSDRPGVTDRHARIVGAAFLLVGGFSTLMLYAVLFNALKP